MSLYAQSMHRTSPKPGTYKPQLSVKKPKKSKSSVISYIGAIEDSMRITPMPILTNVRTC